MWIINVGVLVLNIHSTTVGTSYTTVSTYPGGGVLVVVFSSFTSKFTWLMN